MRTKPSCKKCGSDHWYFVKCADAPARNEVEERNATVTAINVTPVWRTGKPWARDQLTSWENPTGTNTFFRKRDNDEAA